MAKYPALKDMTAAQLLAVRGEIDSLLSSKVSDERRELERQIAALDRATGGRSASAKGRGHALKGTKVAPKFRGPDGELWAGRGATPRWLAAAIKAGSKKEDFAIGTNDNARVKRKYTRRAA